MWYTTHNIIDMAKKKEQQRRRCAMCRKTGHNKKTCPNFVLEKKVKKDTLPPKRHTKKAKTKVIRVTVKKDQKTSPHVVNLRKKEDTQTLNDVALYKKKVSSIPARVDVDFARYIKEANNKKKECIPIIEEPKKIKRQRVSSIRSKIEDLKEKGKDIKELKSSHKIIRKISTNYSIYCSPGHFIDFSSEIKNKEKLKKFLFNHQIKKKFQFSLEWENDQLAIWDNRSMLHQATPFKGNRIMHRITIE